MTYQNQPHKPTSLKHSTKDLFESLVRGRPLVTITFLCGDTIQGRFVWFDLVGVMFISDDGLNNYIPRKNIQKFSWGKKNACCK